MIRIITNSNGSGDWVIVETDGTRFHQGHSIGIGDVVDLLRNLGHEVEWKDDLTDDEINDWVTV